MTSSARPLPATKPAPGLKADQLVTDLVRLLSRESRPAPDPKSLQALLAGIAATPDSVDHAWMDLVALPPRTPELVVALNAARAALKPAPLDTSHETTRARLKALRGLMEDQGLAGFLVPRADAHQGEFVAANAERLAWLTGFTGSAGLAIVLQDRAAFFVDGRYTLQAAEQIDTSLWTIIATGQTSPADWLTSMLRRGDKVGYDPWLHTISETDHRARACAKVGAKMVEVSVNPIDTLWRDRPPSPLGPVVPHPATHAGEDATSKRKRIAALIREQNCTAAVLHDPASLAWLLNIRGADIPFTPVALGYAILHDDARVDLFMDSRKFTAAVYAHLGPEVRTHPSSALGQMLDSLGTRKRRVLLDRSGSPQWIKARLTSADARVHLDRDPVALPRARKSSAELAGMRAAHVRDGVALTRFLCWLDREGPLGTQTETTAAAHLQALRANDETFRGPSFPTISGAGPNGAIVHYRATEDTTRRIEPDMLYLVDSGGQYRNGTTDVTRTVCIGTPTTEQIRRFTQVLKGHIAIARVVFPQGTTGVQLDVLARLALWSDGVDFEHGTGHGVGSYLGVHEGPQRISKRPSDVALEPGMIISNEPGYYLPGAFGIRIENLIAVRTVEPPDGAEVSLLGFETLTLAPIDRRLIDPTLMADTERTWLDAYHARVAAEIGPHLDDDTRQWLEAATQPLLAEDRNPGEPRTTRFP